jgi:hypothetical protein
MQHTSNRREMAGSGVSLFWGLFTKTQHRGEMKACKSKRVSMAWPGLPCCVFCSMPTSCFLRDPWWLWVSVNSILSGSRREKVSSMDGKSHFLFGVEMKMRTQPPTPWILQ